MGIVFGVAGAALYKRLRELVENSEPERVVDRLADQVEALERRLSHTEANASKAHPA